MDILYETELASRVGNWMIVEYGRQNQSDEADINSTIEENYSSSPSNNLTKSSTPTADLILMPKELLIILHCKTTFLPFKLGKVFPNLKSIVIWFSGLRKFNASHFLDMSNLHEISFQDNAIESLEETSFWSVPNITSLNLGSNRIKLLEKNLLKMATKLKTFIINRNLIEYLPPLLFVNNMELVFINLNNNKIKVVEVDFTILTSIVKILGIGNDCADFFLNKNVDAVQLNELMKTNCSKEESRNVTESSLIIE